MMRLKKKTAQGSVCETVITIISLLKDTHKALNKYAVNAGHCINVSILPWQKVIANFYSINNCYLSTNKSVNGKLLGIVLFIYRIHNF